jgi:membrane associated rhomboid family serine protease
VFPLRDTVRAREIPIVNYAIIALNVLIFLFEASLRPRALESFISSFGLVPRRFLLDFGLGQLITVFSSMFLHGGWVHLISNMWALYIFGDNIEDRMGHGRYLAFYLICGFAAAIAHVVVAPRSAVPVVGASGAISGVMGAYIVLFPLSRVITLVPGLFFLPWFVEVPALLFIGMWFLSQLFSGLVTLAVPGSFYTYGGVAWWAHVGGFLAGVILVRAFARRRRYRYWYLDEYWPW